MPFAREAKRYLVLAVCLLPLIAAGCARDGSFQAISMWNESRLKPMEPLTEGGSDSSARAFVPGTVARGQMWEGDPVMSGRSGGRLVTRSPIPITEEVLARGQERFNVYCAPCHGGVGDGQGMIVRRGFPHPPDYAIPRLRRAPLGHYFDVMTNGYGVMYPYADRVQPADRWAIAAYIRVLQANRPVVTVDPYEAERQRARQTGILRRNAPPDAGTRGQNGTPPPQLPTRDNS